MPGEKRMYAHHASFLSSLISKLHRRRISSQFSEEEDHLLQSLDIHLTVSLRAVHSASKLEIWSLEYLRQLMAAMLEASLFLQNMLPAYMHALFIRSNEKSLNAFLDSNARYLDACNAVREGIGSVEHLQLYVKSSLHIFEASKSSLSEPHLKRARKQVKECLSVFRNDQSEHRISVTLSSLQAISDKLFPPKRSEAYSLLQAFAMAEYTTSVISLFALGMSLAAFLPGDKARIIEALHISPYSAWSVKFLNLQEEAKQSIATKKALQHGLLSELDKLHACLSRLSVILESATSLGNYPMSPEQERKLCIAVEDLRGTSLELEDDLRATDDMVSMLFRQLISCRNAVLDLFSLASMSYQNPDRGATVDKSSHSCETR